MGIFDFVKNVGKKLGIGDDEAPEAEAVKKELDSYGLGTEKVDVEIDGDKVILKGAVQDQSIFEKAIVAVGNTLGISKVEASELKVVAPDSGLKLNPDVDMTELVKASIPASQPARAHHTRALVRDGVEARQQHRGAHQLFFQLQPP